MTALQLLMFPKGWHFGGILDGRRKVQAEPGIRLAWQRAAGLFLRCSRNDGL